MDTTARDEPTKPVRMGVVGLGNMGRNHVRVLSEIPGAELVAVADADPTARARVVRARRIPAYPDHEQLFVREALDAVVVAVPTVHHEEVAVAAFEHGLHVLIEKPLGPSLAAAQRIVDAASAAGVVATVGHVERYNPAVTKLRSFLDEGALGRIFEVRAVRAGPLPSRIQDVGVVVDLATHDLDVIRYLVDRPLESVFAQTARRLHSAHEDLAVGVFRFVDGAVALLDVNWLTPIKVRDLTVIGQRGMFRLDYLGQNLAFHENSDVQYWEGNGGRLGVSEGDMVQYRIDRAEPLRREHEAFLRAIGGDPDGLVPLQDGLSAVALAEAVLRSATEGRNLTDAELSPILVRDSVAVRR